MCGGWLISTTPCVSFLLSSPSLLCFSSCSLRLLFCVSSLLLFVAGRVFRTWKTIDLEVGREGIGQVHMPRERRQNDVAQLNTRRRNHIAEAVVMVAQELGEVVQQNQQRFQRALVQQPNRLG